MTALGRRRTASTTTIGSSAATAPLTLINAVRPAHSSIITTIKRPRSPPTRLIIRSPAHVVTPVASRPSLITNSVAMNTTDASPKPLIAWSSVSTPVAYSVRAAPMATISTGKRFQTNSTTSAPSTLKLIAMSDMAITAGSPDGVIVPWLELDRVAGPSGMPSRYQATKSAIHVTATISVYGIISEMIVPMPASFL